MSETKFKTDLDNAMGIVSFFESKNIPTENRTFTVKSCSPYLYDEEGDIIYDAEGNPKHDESKAFTALGLSLNKLTDDGKPSYDFFRLSNKLADAGEELNEAFLVAHAKEIQLAYVYDDAGKQCKFGTLFLPGTAKNISALGL